MDLALQSVLVLASIEHVEGQLEGAIRGIFVGLPVVVALNGLLFTGLQGAMPMAPAMPSKLSPIEKKPTSSIEACSPS